MNRTAKRLPRGCDQQGRYPEANDLIEPDADAPEHSFWTVIVPDILVVVAVLLVVSLIVTWVAA